ncbi:hypothetical protein Zmor_021635 [Zophobas morio]|uniref:Uncharacterized protein n=1 Tax=Zophobas morio TaxID=2755281 RepID=A0AA38I9N1_9CUCU|nr:hypothetical protein Zmor_021635 [Zophobas morio]
MGGRKIPHQKHYHPDPYFALPSHGNHGPHIPIGAVVHTRPGQIGHIKPHATTSKPFIQISSTTSKRNIKPMRIQTSTSGYRDEIFTASATSGAYNHYKHGPSNIRTRETIDLGLPGSNNHYSINQPHAHIEFNRFSLTPTSESVFEQYNTPSIPPYIFGKNPQSNDLDYQIQTHNNDFSRNVLPAPQIYKNKDYITRDRPNVQENVVLQVPPPIQYTQQNINEPPPVQVHVTKEKLHEFHNNIPPNYHGQYIEFDFSKVRKPTEAPKPIYEVTESQVWQEPSSKRPVRTRKPSQPKRRPETINDEAPVFLPTPYKPEKPSVEPTSPTQSEVSTIFSKLSKVQREKGFATPDPFGFSIKEVSTHYPVFGRPVFGQLQSSKEISNEITTFHEDVETTTREPQRIRPQRRRRPDRRTTTTTTTEEPEFVYAVNQVHEDEYSQPVETERPVRTKRPIRPRTTTPSSEETVKINRGRNRFRHRNPENYESTKIRQRPSRLETATQFSEHKSEEYHRESSQSSSFENDEAASEKSEEIEESPKSENTELDLPEHHYSGKPGDSDHHETIKPFIILTTTEKVPTTNLVIPESEYDDITTVPNIEDISTTTTAAPTTTSSNPHRIKGRPLKFDNSNRPRFSVKDYRQKYNLQSSTSAPQVHRSTESPRIRLPSRLRRPLATTAATIEEENTETIRPKFMPKDPRHAGTTETPNIITEKNVKSINTRLRPFGRYKSTTTSTTTTTATPRVAIKSNLFNRKRPPMLSLRNKILNKQYKNNAETTTEKSTTTEENEVTDSTVDYGHEIEVDSTTESNWKVVRSTEDYDDAEATTTIDLSKIDPYFYSQRVSDLTSSAKNDYNTPGLFKSVAPTSRRIPNYFTISTDDPILPIEAFFSNIKDKTRDKDP